MECLLVINGGSSSIKFALYRTSESPQSLELLIKGKLDRIGFSDSNLIFRDFSQDFTPDSTPDSKINQQQTQAMEASDTRTAANNLIAWLEKRVEFSSVIAIGHRLVLGMQQTEPVRVTSDVLNGLRQIIGFDPDHLPSEIALIETFQSYNDALVQVACFDTDFHQTMPKVAKQLPIPRRFEAKGVRRYGFHGISYAYVVKKLKDLTKPQNLPERVIIAHLGNGASMAAIQNGVSIDTSMGFTPSSGLVMGTRPGDIDPGLVWFLMENENLTAKEFNSLINHECGLLGISETSSDMRDLIKSQKTDLRAAEAVDLFCYQAKKYIGAYAAALGGLECLVFSGGIGEKSSEIRAKICEGLEFLNITIDKNKNQTDADIISLPNSRVTVRIIATDEEWMIANLVDQFLKKEGL